MNDPIQVSKSGLQVGDKLGHTSGSNTNTIDVTVTYNSNQTTQPVSTTTSITLQINYQQDLSASQGGSGNGGSSAVGFDTTTGTIYRYRQNLAHLRLGDSIEDKMEDEDFGIVSDRSDFIDPSPVYLKHDVENYEITMSYLCFVTNQEYCMQSGVSNYETNRGILQANENWFNTHNDSDYVCWDNSYQMGCQSNEFGVELDKENFNVSGFNADSAVDCMVLVDGDSWCSY